MSSVRDTRPSGTSTCACRRAARLSRNRARRQTSRMTMSAQTAFTPRRRVLRVPPRPVRRPARLPLRPLIPPPAFCLGLNSAMMACPWLACQAIRGCHSAPVLLPGRSWPITSSSSGRCRCCSRLTTCHSGGIVSVMRPGVSSMRSGGCWLWAVCIVPLS